MNERAPGASITATAQIAKSSDKLKATVSRQPICDPQRRLYAYRLQGSSQTRPQQLLDEESSHHDAPELICNIFMDTEGKALGEILAARRSVAEGVATAAAVVALAKRLKVDMPISAAVDAVLYHGADIDKTIDALLRRPLKAE